VKAVVAGTKPKHGRWDEKGRRARSINVPTLNAPILRLVYSMANITLR